MRRGIAWVAGIVLLVSMAGCEGGRGTAGAAVTDEEAKQAFVISFGSVLVASMATSFGEEVDGVELNEEGDQLSLDGFDLSDHLGDGAPETPYTAISGTIDNEEERMKADLTLEGGPVDSIEFSIGAEEMQATEGFSTTLTVNGRETELDITPEDLQG
ncbi:MAG: hypothetical protein ACOC2D_20900 [Spirochaetota bacterium]